MVGPSATELESLQELIQFDHVYYKTRPECKTSSQSPLLQLKPKQTVITPKCVQKVTENGLRNVKIIITTDSDKKRNATSEMVQIPNVILDTNMLKQRKTVPQINPKGANLANPIETLELDVDNNDLADLNFDLLDDLESILSQDCEGLTCSDDITFLPSQENVTTELTKCVENVQKGQKRKAPTSEIVAIVDNLTANFPPSPTQSVYSVGDSDYSSGSPLPYSMQSVGSPIGEDEDLHEEIAWEESFTELFPDLI